MKLEKKFGLFTAIGMVVGIVIGSGVFFKAQTVLQKTEGNMPLGILAWIIGGIIMTICACTFGFMATKYEKVNGLIDYAEVTVGKKYGYFMGWFVATIYYPVLTGVLAWLCARYTGALFGWELNSTSVLALGSAFLAVSYAINALSPKLAGKLQVSTTVIKLIPLILMAIVGTIYGLIKTAVSYSVVDGAVVKEGSTQLQILINNFKSIGSGSNNSGTISILLGATVSTAFAYDGWIIATSINAELKNAKRNLPIALFFGSLVIVVIYILYYIGVAGGATVDVLMVGGANYSFLQIFGDFFGTILNVFIVISCIGTLNGLMIASTRGLYSIAERDMGPKPSLFKEIDPHTNMPSNSAVIGLLLSVIWYILFYGGNLADPLWFGDFSFDSSELPIVTIYAMYIPIYIMMVIKERKSFGVFKGIIMPILSVCSCIFMIIAAIVSHKLDTIWYLIVYIIIMSVGAIFLFIKPKEKKIEIK